MLDYCVVGMEKQWASCCFSILCARTAPYVMVRNFLTHNYVHLRDTFVCSASHAGVYYQFWTVVANHCIGPDCRIDFSNATLHCKNLMFADVAAVKHIAVGCFFAFVLNLVKEQIQLLSHCYYDANFHYSYFFVAKVDKIIVFCIPLLVL